jgi:hypothetical protein
MTYTKSELINSIHTLADRVEDTPTAIDLNNHSDLPYSATYRRYFGSWNSALIEAGYEPNRRHRNYEGTESPNEYYERVKDSMNCVVCGESGYACIEFHHVEDKDFALSRTPHLAVEKDDVYREFQKCLSLCANCHKKNHSNKHDTDFSNYSVPEYPEPEY